MTTKITTVNTAGMLNLQRRREILHNIETLQNDITLLQETHITPDMYRQTSKLWTGTMLFSPGKQNTDGTIICIKDNTIKLTNTVNNPNGKFQITDIRIDKLNITLINVYAPSRNTTQNQYKRKEFWEDLTKTVSTFIKQDKHYILAGDFNVTLQDIDKTPGTDQLTAEFYKKLWPLLTESFTIMTNAVLNRKCLTATQKEALICCIYKKGDRADITNWRPISLLNIDYKTNH